MTRRRMSHPQAVRALAALAHDTRLEIHRLLVQAGEAGLSAGFLARELGLPASSLSFHLAHLRGAGVITQRRLGRSLIYAADFGCVDGLLEYLQENCCRGFAAEGCGAAAGSTAAREAGKARPRPRRAAGVAKHSGG